MSKVQIICSVPGLIRNGVPHSTSEIYEEDHWTVGQLARFMSDPAFTVRTIDDEEAARGSAFDDAVAAEVNKRVSAKVEEIQQTFQNAVNAASRELVDEIGLKLKDAQAKITELEDQLSTATANADNTIDDLGKKLTIAEATVADLQKQLEAATAPQDGATGKAAPKK